MLEFKLIDRGCCILCPKPKSTLFAVGEIINFTTPCNNYEQQH